MQFIKHFIIIVLLTLEGSLCYRVYRYNYQGIGKEVTEVYDSFAFTFNLLRFTLAQVCIMYVHIKGIPYRIKGKFFQHLFFFAHVICLRV